MPPVPDRYRVWVRDPMSMGMGRRWGIGIGVFFTLTLIPVGVDTWRQPPGPARIVALALLIVYGAGYLFSPTLKWRSAMPEKLAVVAALLALGGGFVAVRGLGWMPLLGYGYAVAAMLLPVVWSLATGAAILTCFALFTAYAADPPWDSYFALVTILVDLLLMGMLVRSNAALHRARHELAAHAVSDERARVARDLHDVLGHTLTTLAVKGALARRLLEEGFTDRAAQEMADIERQSREALVELRATVSGYREASLDAELAGARVALAAGQIAAEVTGDVEEVPAYLREAFAFVVREGVTNVIRHSSATSCRIHIGPSSVEITDDGTGQAAPSAGAGLSGLRQRVSAVGGELTTGPLDEGGFRLRARIGDAK